MKEYKVGVCCTFGAGSSMMLKMNLDTIFSKLGLNASVEVYDISGISNAELDIIFTSKALSHQVESSVKDIEVVPVSNYFDSSELQELTKKYFTEVEGE